MHEAALAVASGGLIRKANCCRSMPSCGGWLGVCLSVMFAYCVETADDTVIIAIRNSTEAFEWYHFE